MGGKLIFGSKKAWVMDLLHTQALFQILPVDSVQSSYLFISSAIMGLVITHDAGFPDRKESFFMIIFGETRK